MIPADVDSPLDEHIRLAGQFDRLGDKVPRGFLSVLCDSPAQIGDDNSGRMELAHWLTDEHQGAGQVAARVLANRVWHHLIGRGIVRTVDNFGRTGEAASHPELLDHLARQLIDSGWSIKQLVRTIVLSRTFAISSAVRRCRPCGRPGQSSTLASESPPSQPRSAARFDAGGRGRIGSDADGIVRLVPGGPSHGRG